METSVPRCDVRAGEPARCGSLAVIPLYLDQPLIPPSIDYLLSDEAQAAGTCIVHEVSEAGVVEKLMVENAGEQPVLFVEGEELCGAKQNRIVRSSVLVGAGSRIVMPVFCVERKRWDSSSGCLKTGCQSPPSLRHILKGGRLGAGLARWGSGQVAVWRFIADRHLATGTRSPKENMADALRARPEVQATLRKDLRYPEGASGIAVAMRGRTIGADLFDRPQTLRKLWDRLVVLGLTLDALDIYGEDNSEPDLPVRLYGLRSTRWQRIETAGLGEAYRAAGDDGSLATALMLDGELIHLSIAMPAGLDV